MKKIYISPSDQISNVYYDPAHNEKEVTETIARLLVGKLAKYDVTTMLNTGKDIQSRLNEANAAKVDYYLVIHTNAFNRSEGRGCETYFQDGADNPTLRNQLSLEFATNVNNEVSAITTSNTLVGDRGTKHAHLPNMQDRLWELRDINTPAAYSEVEFHDTAVGCAWLLANLDATADAFCRAVVKTMKLTLLPVASAEPTYKVVAGDTLSGIAARFNTSVATLAILNSITNVNLIHVGQILKLPNVGTQPVPQPVPEAPFIPGVKVTIKLLASRYATGQSIPLWAKVRGIRPIVYTIGEVYPKTGTPTKALLLEILSWVNFTDLKRV